MRSVSSVKVYTPSTHLTELQQFATVMSLHPRDADAVRDAAKALSDAAGEEAFADALGVVAFASTLASLDNIELAKNHAPTGGLRQRVSPRRDAPVVGLKSNDGPFDRREGRVGDTRIERSEHLRFRVGERWPPSVLPLMMMARVQCMGMVPVSH